MKKHPALIPFPRDPHGAFILSRLLQNGVPAFKGLPAGIAGKDVHAMGCFSKNLPTRFQAEKIYGACLKHKDIIPDATLLKMVLQHQNVTPLFQAVQDPDSLKK